MDDLISRQAAIDAVQRHREGVLGGYEYDEGIAFGYAAAHNHIIDVIKQLPSAQSDIVYCLECKYGSPNGVYGCRLERFSFMDESVVMHTNDFCSKGERRADG